MVRHLSLAQTTFVYLSYTYFYTGAHFAPNSDTPRLNSLHCHQFYLYCLRGQLHPFFNSISPQLNSTVHWVLMSQFQVFAGVDQLQPSLPFQYIVYPIQSAGPPTFPIRAFAVCTQGTDFLKTWDLVSFVGLSMNWLNRHLRFA